MTLKALAAWAMLASGPLGACTGGSAGDAGAASSVGRAPTSHTVEIGEMAFHPPELRVQPGDTVLWINLDFVPHTATAPDSAWTSPTLAQGERWQMVVRGSDAGDAVAGSPDAETYACAFHPVMEARLIIHAPTSTEEMP